MWWMSILCSLKKINYPVKRRRKLLKPKEKISKCQQKAVHFLHLACQPGRAARPTGEEPLKASSLVIMTPLRKCIWLQAECRPELTKEVPPFPPLVQVLKMKGEHVFVLTAYET